MAESEVLAINEHFKHPKQYMEQPTDKMVRKHVRLLLDMLIHIDSWRRLSETERGYVQFVNSLLLGSESVSVTEADNKTEWMKDVEEYYSHRCMSFDEALSSTGNKRLFGC